MVKILLIGGLISALLGLLIMAGVPIGRLPGDIKVHRGNTTFYIPITTSIIIGVVLTIVLALLRR